MSFLPPDSLSLCGFLVVLVFVLGAVVASVHAIGGAGRATWTAFALLLWLGLTSSIVASGLLAEHPMPRLLYFVAASNLVAIAFALSPLGGKIAFGVPVWTLIGFQGFRLPLEFILHSWANTGVIPPTMTWTGANFDIVSGGLAFLIAPFAERRRWLAWIFNAVGLALLLNVARVAVFSSPLPFAWHVTPPLLLAFHLPYALIVPVCVAGALAGHVLLTRRLIHDAHSVSSHGQNRTSGWDSRMRERNA